jgi:poly(3-hydroxybutyrate) depolymerase
VSNPKLKPPKVDAPGKQDTGIVKRTTADGEHRFWLYVPEDYDANVSHSLLVWLHPPGKNKDDDLETYISVWEEYCIKHHAILVLPISDNDAGWLPGESDFVVEAIQDAAKRYTVDRQRIVAHGLGVGGQMALHLGWTYRDLIRGVATVGAIPTTIKDNLPSQRLAFFLVGGDLDPLTKGITESRDKLQDKRFSVVLRVMPNRGREYLEEAQFRDLQRWLDVLDQQ